MGLYIIVDYNNFIFKRYFKYKNKIDIYKEKWDDIIMDIIKEVLSDISYYSYIVFANGVIVVDDYGSWRKEFYNNYKVNRKEKNLSYNYDFLLKLKEKFAEVTSWFRILYFKMKNLESDDCVYLWSNFLYKTNKNVVILSTDTDFNQLLKVNENNFVSILKYRKNNGNNGNGKFIKYNKKSEYGLVFSVPKGFNDIYFYNNKSEDVDDLKILQGGFKWDNEKYRLLKNFKRFNVTIEEVDINRDLLRKIMCGDYSDNIKSIWYGKYKNKKMKFNIDDFNNFYSFLNSRYNFFTVDDIINNRDVLEDLVCMLENRKKVSNIDVNEIYENMVINNKLINLKYIPEEYTREFMNYIDMNYKDIFKGFDFKKLNEWIGKNYNVV